MTDLVFISYSNADTAVADAICAELERAGIRCWIAPRDITPGRMWSEAIIDGINASRVMILIHSRHSNKSPQCVREVERAVNRRMLLLQVRLEEIKPSRALEFFIASSQWLNAFPKPIDAYLASLPQLVRNLLAEAVETGEHTAERTAEHATLTSSPGQYTHGEVRPVVSTAMPKATSWRTVVTVMSVLTTVGLVSTWLYSELVRDRSAPTVPANSSLNSGLGSGSDSVVKTATVGKDSVVPALRIAAAATTYKIGQRFSLRVEPNGAKPLRWRSGDTRVLALSPGDSVFRAIAVGSAFLYAENATQRDSVHMSVVEDARVVDRNPVRLPSSPGAAQVKETTTTVAGNERAGSAGKEKDAPPALTDALAGTKASECMRAVTAHDATWMRAHYGSSLTATDAANLKNLESMFSRRQYRADLLHPATFAGNVVSFSMRVGYQGGFGPRLSVDVPFEVRMVNDQPHGEVATCRVRGTLKSP